MRQFLDLSRFREEPITYRIVVSPTLVPICADGGMDVREGIAAYPHRQSWLGDQMMVVEGLVIGVGPLAGMNPRMGNEVPCKVGDIVRFKQYAGIFTMLSHHVAEKAEPESGLVLPDHVAKGESPKRETWDEFVMYMNDEDILGLIFSEYELIDPASVYINNIGES